MKRVCEQLWLMIAQTISEFAQVASLVSFHRNRPYLAISDVKTPLLVIPVAIYNVFLIHTMII